MSDFKTSPLKAFREQVQHFTRQSKFHRPPRPFLLADSLRDWLRKPIDLEYGHRSTRAGYLLEVVLTGQEPYTGAFREYGDTLQKQNDHRFLDLVIVLLQINMGSEKKALGLTPHLVRSGYFQMPAISLLQDPSFLEYVRGTGYLDASECIVFYDEFKRLALQLVADHSIRTVHEYEVVNGMIMPFIFKESIGRGGQSEVFRTHVPAQSLPDDVRDRLEEQSVPEAVDEVQYYELALKKVEHEDDWQREINFHRATRDTGGIVKCYGSWKVRNEKNGFDYYLLLELGWWDLEHYFETFAPPTSPDSIIMFWTNFRNIIETLSHIHNLEIQSQTGTKTYYGWHGDIKLSNILICPEDNKQEMLEVIKLTDPGFAKLELAEKAKVDYRNEPIVQLHGGTDVYGGPERHNPTSGKTDTSIPVTRSFDIWSLGCAAYEAATWVILGQNGFSLFKLLRKMKGRQFDHYTDIDGTEEFHENGDIASVIGEWHQHLIRCLRRDDYLSGELLDIAREFMLRTNPHDRASAAELTGYFDEAIHIAREQYRLRPWEISENISEALRFYRQQVDQEAENNKKTSSAKPTSGFSTRNNMAIGPYSNAAQKQVAPRERRNLPSAALPYGFQNPDTDVPGLTQHIRRQELTMVPDVLPTNTQSSEMRESERPHFGYWRAVRLLVDNHWSLATAIDFPGSSKPYPPPSSKSSGRFGILKRPTLQNPSRTSVEGLGNSSLSHAWARFRPSKNGRDERSHQTVNVVHQNPRQDMFGQYFRDRDIIMLFDNSKSMSPHWAQVQAVACVLMALLWDQDKTGVDLYFSSSKDKSVREMKQPSHLQEELKKESPSLRAREGLQFDGIFPTLDQVTQTIKSGKEYPNKVTIIIFTDGAWNEADRGTVETIIEAWLKFAYIRGHNLHDKRRYTVQFIHFGDNEEGYIALEAMDDDLCKRIDVTDVIDVERADGNILKMIMGSLDEVWDDIKTPEQPKTTQSTGSIPRLSSFQHEDDDQPSDKQFLRNHRKRVTGHTVGTTVEPAVPGEFVLAKSTDRSSAIEQRSAATWGSFKPRTGTGAVGAPLQPRGARRASTNLHQSDNGYSMANIAGRFGERDRRND